MNRSEDSLKFESIWRSLRKEKKGLPSFAEFSPAVFKDFLPSISLTEIDPDEGTHSIRLVGDRVRQLFAEDPRGEDINHYVPDDKKDAMKARQASFHIKPVGRYGVRHAIFENNKTVAIHLTQLPMWGQNGERLLLNFWQMSDEPTAKLAQDLDQFLPDTEAEIEIDLSSH